MENRVPSTPYLLAELMQDGRYRYNLLPMFLGGVGGENGGSGGPPSGFIGQLIQTRVAYDVTEAELSTGSASLVDNLNHIRYRVAQLEDNPEPTTGFQRYITTGTHIGAEISALAYEYVEVTSTGSLGLDAGATLFVSKFGNSDTPPRIVTVSTSMNGGDTLLISTASSPIGIYLPPNDEAYRFRTYSVKRRGSADVTVYPYSSALIDGSGSLVLGTINDAAHLLNDGTNWYSV